MNNIQKKEEYNKIVKSMSPKSNILKNCIIAFISGGFISIIGQIINNIAKYFHINNDNSALITSITLISISALLTGLGIYSKLGKFCGAGTIVPITGFANSVVSPAIEFKKEGYIFGMGAKMFIIAGPVIVYGILSSMLVGLVYYFIK